MNQYMEEAVLEAAQCWCDDETSGKQMAHNDQHNRPASAGPG